MITITDVTKSFDGFLALENVNMHVHKGSVYGLVGPNGAGKSTIIRHITGVYRPDSGEVKIDGSTVYENEAIKARTVYIPDDLFFFQNASTLDMMKYYKGIYPTFDMERFEKLSTVFTGIDQKTPLRKLSKGMKKQVLFWIIMCCNPELIVLDEPVDGLDPVMRKQIWGLLMADVAERQTTVLISSHNLRELEDVCDYVGIMNHGRIILERSLSELQDNITKLQVSYKDEMPALPDTVQVLSHSVSGHIHTLIMKGNPASVQQQIAVTKPLLMDALPLSLEEIFIHELGGAGYECKEILL